MEEYNAVNTIIEVLNTYGVDFLFFNPGIDNVPLLETVARYHASGLPSPRGILCLDEFVAMTAAHGNYMASGKPQAVSVHSELGVLQIGGALHNAQWGKVPVVFFTEIQGPPQRTNWRGEAFDQGMMVRSFVKWDHRLEPGENIGEVFSQAFNIATTEPCGPVYLNLPREVFWSRDDSPARPAISKTSLSPPEPDIKLLQQAATLLLQAQNPLIITGYSGRNVTTVAFLIELAETLAARVQAADVRVNFPNTHPLFALQSPSPGTADPLTGADVILAIDYDMHYAAPPVSPAADARIIHIDIDIEKKGAPLWNKKPDILIRADSARAIPALTGLVRQQMTDARRGELKERYSTLKTEYEKLSSAWQMMAQSHASRKPITPHWLSACLNEAIDDDTVIVNQTISPSATVAQLVHRTKPGSLLSCAGGCIGWAPGAALGAKLALPDKTVVSLMGDGAFIYGCPEASLWSSSVYRAPFLAVIYDNQGYGAIKGLFRTRYDGENMGADITAPPDYAQISRANHAYGRTVTEPAEVLVALKDCLAVVHGGQTAVLDVKIEPV